MDWTTIITSIISALAGGGLISLLTLRETKKSLKIDNKAKEDDRWSKLADELQDENVKLNDRLEKKDSRVTELEDTVSDLRTKLDSTRTKCAIAEILRCETVSCPSRVPPLGVRNMDIEKIVESE
jgi:predicted nuclease with TOPRIM domain